MKRKNNRTNLKITLALSTVIFSLATSFVGTIAWFATNNQVMATGCTVTVYADNTELSYSIYKFDVDQNIPVRLSGNNASGFSLNQYDVVFKERNKYNPLYLEIELVGSILGDSGNLTFLLGRDVSISPMDGNNRLSSSFTSVTKFAIGTNGSIQNGIYNPANGVADTWDNLNNAFYSRDSLDQLITQSFTSGTSGNYIKQDSLSFSISYSSSDFINDILYVFLYINYDSTLAESYSSEHGISIGGSLNYSLSDDLTTISIAKG